MHRDDSAVMMEPGSSLKGLWPGWERAECLICRESFKTGEMVQLECDHWYCRPDLRSKLKLTSIKGRDNPTPSRSTYSNQTLFS